MSRPTLQVIDPDGNVWDWDYVTVQVTVHDTPGTGDGDPDRDVVIATTLTREGLIFDEYDADADGYPSGDEPTASMATEWLDVWESLV